MLAVNYQLDRFCLSFVSSVQLVFLINSPLSIFDSASCVTRLLCWKVWFLVRFVLFVSMLHWLLNAMLNIGCSMLNVELAVVHGEVIFLPFMFVAARPNAPF